MPVCIFLGLIAPFSQISARETKKTKQMLPFSSFSSSCSVIVRGVHGEHYGHIRTSKGYFKNQGTDMLSSTSSDSLAAVIIHLCCFRAI